jgi:tetratricopeptide (TPR) repeat protein
MTRTHRCRLLAKRAVKRVEADRGRFGLALATDPVGVTDLARVLEARSGCIRHALLSAAYEITPAPLGWELSLSLFNTDAGDRFCAHYAVSVSDPLADACSVDDHRLYALVCTLPLAVRRDSAQFQRIADEIRNLPGVWVGGVAYDDLLAVALPAVWARSIRWTGQAEADGDPRALYDAGATACERGGYSEADAYLHAAVSSAVASAQWPIALLSLVKLGSVAAERGDYRAARAHHRRALNLARRCVPEGRGMVYHEMYWLAADLGETECANHLARKAAKAYGRAHPWFARLLHDVGYNWIAWGAPEAGLPLVRATWETATRTPEEQVCSWGAIARGAGALNDHPLLALAAARLQSLRAEAVTERRAAEAMTNLARGLASVGEWREAEAACREAIAIATRRREAKTLFEAQAVHASVQAHRRMDARAAPPGTGDLAKSFLRALAAA